MSDKIIRAFLTLVLAAVFLCSGSKLTFAGEQSINVQSSTLVQQKSPPKTGWLKVTYSQGTVTSIGQYQLYYPLRVPEGMLLTRYAYVHFSNQKYKRVSADFFFAPQSETAVKRWAENFSAQYPIDSKYRRKLIVHKLETQSIGSSWLITSVAWLTHDAADFMLNGTAGCAALDKNIHDEHASGTADSIMPEWCSEGSPVKTASRIIFLEATVPYKEYLSVR